MDGLLPKVLVVLHALGYEKRIRDLEERPVVARYGSGGSSSSGSGGSSGTIVVPTAAYPVQTDTADGKRYRYQSTNGRLDLTETTEAVTGFTAAYYDTFTYEDASWTYLGKALKGSPRSSPVWSVWREARYQLLVQNADGNRNYDNPFTDLATAQGLTYS